MSGRGKTRIEELEKEGWVRQFMASEPRLSEAVELYKESGFEVHLEPLPEGKECLSCAGKEKKDQGECSICFEGFENLYKIIYTRPSKDRKAF